MLHHQPHQHSSEYDPQRQHNDNNCHYKTPSPLRERATVHRTDQHDWHSHHHHRNSSSRRHHHPVVGSTSDKSSVATRSNGAGMSRRHRGETASVTTMSVLEAFSTLPDVTTTTTTEDDRNGRQSSTWSSQRDPNRMHYSTASVTPWSKIPGAEPGLHSHRVFAKEDDDKDSTLTVEDRPPVAIVVAKKKKKKKNKGSLGKALLLDSRSSIADSKMDMYMCSTCHVPMKGHECPYEAKRKRSKVDSGNNSKEQQTLSPKAKRVLYDKTQSEHYFTASKSSTQVYNNKYRSDESAFSSINNGKGKGSAIGARNQEYFSSQQKATPKAKKIGNLICSSCGIEVVGESTCRCRTSSQCSRSVRKMHDADDGAQLSALVAVTAESQRWTELMIPANMLQDELHKYLMQQQRRLPLTESDSVFLCTWTDDVYRQLRYQNDLVLETMDILDSQKSVRMNIDKERDAQISLHAESRRLQAENQQILHRMTAQREESGTNTAVIRLLEAIDTMRLPVDRESENF